MALSMGVRQAYVTGLRTAVSTPAVPVAAAALVASTAVPVAVQLAYPVLGQAVGMLLYLILPFTLAGLLAVAADGLDGNGELSAFVPAGKASYVPITIGLLLVAAMWFVAYLLANLLVVVAGVGLLVATGGTVGSVGPGVALLVALVAALVAVLLGAPLYLLQFFAAAVREAGLDGQQSLRRSYDLVRTHPRSVVAFDVVGLVVALPSVVPNLYLLAWVRADLPPIGDSGVLPLLTGLLEAVAAVTLVEIGLYLGSTLLLGTVVSALLAPSYVAFYRGLASRERQPAADTEG